MMKAIALSSLLLFSTFAFADSFKGICPICQKEGKKSKVYVGSCTSTSAFCGNGYYDEEGKFHSPDPCNTITCIYTCSNGHTFSADLPEMKGTPDLNVNK